MATPTNTTPLGGFEFRLDVPTLVKGGPTPPNDRLGYLDLGQWYKVKAKINSQICPSASFYFQVELEFINPALRHSRESLLSAWSHRHPSTRPLELSTVPGTPGHGPGSRILNHGGQHNIARYLPDRSDSLLGTELTFAFRLNCLECQFGSLARAGAVPIGTADGFYLAVSLFTLEGGQLLHTAYSWAIRSFWPGRSLVNYQKDLAAISTLVASPTGNTCQQILPPLEVTPTTLTSSSRRNRPERRLFICALLAPVDDGALGPDDAPTVLLTKGTVYQLRIRPVVGNLSKYPEPLETSISLYFGPELSPSSLSMALFKWTFQNAASSNLLTFDLSNSLLDESSIVDLFQVSETEVKLLWVPLCPAAEVSIGLRFNVESSYFAQLIADDEDGKADKEELKVKLLVRTSLTKEEKAIEYNHCEIRIDAPLWPLAPVHLKTTFLSSFQVKEAFHRRAVRRTALPKSSMLLILDS